MFDKLNSLTPAHNNMEMISKVGKIYHPIIPESCQLTGEKIKDPAIVLLEPQLGFLPSNICVVDSSFAKTITKLLKKEYEYTYSTENSNQDHTIEFSYSIKWVGFNAMPQFKLIANGILSAKRSDSPEDVFSYLCDIGVKGIVSVSKEEDDGLLTRAHCMDIFKWILENKIQKSSLIIN